MKRKLFSIFSFPQSSPPEIILINLLVASLGTPAQVGLSPEEQEKGKKERTWNTQPS